MRDNNNNNKKILYIYTYLFYIRIQGDIRPELNL